MKRFSKLLNKVDLSRPVYFQWYQFRGLNETAQTRRHLALFFYHLTFKRPRFRRSGRRENNTGSSEIRQNLNNWIKITSSVREMCSLWRPFLDLRSAWSLKPSPLPHLQGLLVFQWRGFGDEVEICLCFGFSESFRISNHPCIFIISRLLSSHSPPNLKLQNAVGTLRLYLVTSFQHFWTTHV